MTLAKRKLTVTLVKGKTDKAEEKTFQLEGLRVEARVDNPGGSQSWGTLNARIFGLRTEILNTFTMVAGKVIGQTNNRVIVEAGDDMSGMSRIFDGNIWFAAQNLQGAPDVCLELVGISAMFERIAPAAPNSYKGSFDVATAIEGLTKSIGFAFENSGVTVKLRDHYASGSIIDQIYDLARSAGIMCSIDNRTVAIWPNGGSRSDRIIKVNKDTGLVGYPTISSNGTAIRTVFNPAINISAKIDLESVITPVNGRWYCQTVTHELASLVPDGPWYTVATLTPTDFYVARN